MKNELTDVQDFTFKVESKKQETILKLADVLIFTRLDKSAESILTSMSLNEIECVGSFYLTRVA